MIKFICDKCGKRCLPFVFPVRIERQVKTNAYEGDKYKMAEYQLCQNCAYKVISYICMKWEDDDTDD